jgi:hypothetical protein
MVQEFRASIREEREPEMSGAAGLDDLAVVLKVYESMETGDTVLLPPSWPVSPSRLGERRGEGGVSCR